VHPLIAAHRRKQTRSAAQSQASLTPCNVRGSHNKLAGNEVLLSRHHIQVVTANAWCWPEADIERQTRSASVAGAAWVAGRVIA
jgi:hypothetical protein